MNRDSCHQDNTGTQAVAILVHGTFAGDERDAGEKWWQSGSDASSQLQSKLPEGVRIAEGAEVFHWSGDNSERARNKAAAQLLQHLIKQESRGIEYHLVGHSHGGSVIWNALKLATLCKQPLEGLRSWTTVGTPYLQQRSRSAWNASNLCGIALGLLLLRPAFNGIRHIGEIAWNALMGEKVAFVIKTDEQAGYVAMLRAPAIAFVERMGVAIERTEESIRIGHYDPAGEVSLAKYMFATPEGLLLLATILITAYVFLHLALLCLRPPIESYRIRAEQQLQRRAFAGFGRRWLGIWSKEDEAINGLRATLDLTVSFVGKMMPQERVFLTDAVGLLARPYYWILGPIFNRVIHPLMDEKVRSIVTRSAQGNDRPTATVVDVTPSPLGDCDDFCLPLPEALNTKLLSSADEHARDIAPKLRRLLVQPSLASGIVAFNNELRGNELVHTSYFEHAEILDLIACNVAWAMDRPSRGSRKMAKTCWCRASNQRAPSGDGQRAVHRHHPHAVDRSPGDNRRSPANLEPTREYRRLV
jgi:hypothetical protein